MFSYEGHGVARCPEWNIRDADWRDEPPFLQGHSPILLLPSSLSYFTSPKAILPRLGPFSSSWQPLISRHFSVMFVFHCVTLSDWLLSCMHVSGPIPGQHIPALLSVKRTPQPFLSGQAVFTFGNWEHSFLHRCNFNSWSGITGHMGILFLTKPFYSPFGDMIFLSAFVIFFILAILVDRKCYLVVVLIYIVWWPIILSMFLCVYYFYVSVMFDNFIIHLETFNFKCTFFFFKRRSHTVAWTDLELAT